MKILENIIKKIDDLQQKINAHGNLDAKQAKRIEHKFRLDWNYYSNAMEGNSLTRYETKQLMMNNVTIDGKPFKDIAEMRGHDAEVQEIFTMGRGDVRLSEARIKKMHSTIMVEDDSEKKKLIGQWKEADNHMIISKDERIDFLPYKEVPEAMHDLLNKTNADIDGLEQAKKEGKHPALIAFEFHLHYLTIHPFYDGNGRTGRLLMNMLLIGFGFPPVILSEKSRASYYRLLTAVQGDGADPKDLYVFLGKLLTDSQQLILDAIAGKDIEELDDVDKEIALWKSELDEKEAEVIEKNSFVVKEVWEKGIHSLFGTMLEKLQKFDDLFTGKEITNFINGSGASNVDELRHFEAWFDFSEPDDENVNSAKQSNAKKGVDKLSLRVYFKGFKKKGKNAFNAHFDLSVRFDQFKYGIEADNWLEKKYEKLYSEVYSQQEIKTIVSERTKVFFEEIKRLTAKTN